MIHTSESLKAQDSEFENYHYQLEDCTTICNPLDFERCDISGHLVANSNHDALITYWIEQYSSANLTCIKATRTGPETLMTGVFKSVDLAIQHASKLENALPA